MKPSPCHVGRRRSSAASLVKWLPRSQTSGFAGKYLGTPSRRFEHVGVVCFRILGERNKLELRVIHIYGNGTCYIVIFCTYYQQKIQKEQRKKYLPNQTGKTLGTFGGWCCGTVQADSAELFVLYYLIYCPVLSWFSACWCHWESSSLTWSVLWVYK